MMQKKLRCGIIGFDFGHQLAFANALAELGQVEIAAAAYLPGASAEATERARAWSEGQGIRCYEGHGELLEECGLDFVSVCAPPQKAPQIVEHVCSRGIHVMSEKPIAPDMDGVQRIAEAVRDAGVNFTFGYHAARFSKPIGRAIDAANGGAVGDVRVMNCTWLQNKGPRFTMSVEEARRRKEAGEPSVGELENFGGYALLALNAMAQSSVRSVYTESEAFFYESYRIADIDDMSLVTMEYNSGAVATAIIGRTPTKSIPTTDVRFEIIGSDGAIHVNHGLGDRVFVYGKYTDEDRYEKGGFETPTFGRASHELYVQDFVEAILEDREPALTIDDAVEYQAILQAAHRSAREREAMSVPVP